MRSIITKAIALLITLNIATFAQQKGSFTDSRDKKTYKTVKIGEQVWMAENLNFNADSSKCYDDKPANCTKYGRLYKWETALKACPKGWHLPRKAEWEKLFSFADSTGKEAGKRLKAKSGWKDADGKPTNGTDNFGFSALPYGESFRGNFRGVGAEGFWWCATETQDKMGNTTGTKISFDTFGGAKLGFSSNFDLHSVRCIQGDEAETAKADTEEKAAKEKAEAEAKAEGEAYAKANGGTFTDTRDKKTYKTIKINGQVWLAENLNYAAENSKCYDDKPENCTKYGKLYNWETAMKSCPAGWHLPKNAEWDKLYRSADGTSGTQSPYNSETAGKFLKSTNGWEDKGVTGNGTDKFGFSALPSGFFDDRFFRIGNNGIWWSANEHEKNKDMASYRAMTVKSEKAEGTEYFNKKHSYVSVRCIKD